VVSQAQTKAINDVVVVGASHAAAEAVMQLRKQGWQEGITVIGDEPYLPYQRPPLSKAYFKGDVAAEKLLIRPQATYDKAEATFRLGVRVVTLDVENQQLELANGERIDYSSVILSTGTRARVLPVSGADANNVMYLRTLDDVDRIRSKVVSGTKLLIVGAGYIGLEIAASAVKQGVDVTVLEAQDRVLARVTSPVVSEFYQRVHAQEGVRIVLNVGLQSFSHDATGSKAMLNDGTEIEFDNAIVGIGVVPNVELAQAAGLVCDNGILVNEYTQSSHPNVYAVGDCCNFVSPLYERRIRLESVPNAVEQAKIAVASICGVPIKYDSVPWFWSDQYDVKLQTVGLLQDYDQMVVRGDLNSRKFSVFYFREEKLIAIDAINSPAEFILGKKMVAAKAVLNPNDIANTELNIKTLLSE
jgi:3-phenylpropionate/trans-cinnamate dioxygenase ferredoxin reductase subunit